MKLTNSHIMKLGTFTEEIQWAQVLFWDDIIYISYYIEVARTREQSSAGSKYVQLQAVTGTTEPLTIVLSVPTDRYNWYSWS